MQSYINTVEKAKNYITANVSEVTPEIVSSYCNYSSKQLSRIFEMVTGATLGEYLRWTRLSKALFDLKNSDAPILDIALAHKYESQEAFTRIFKSTFGITPGECRKSDAGIRINNNSHLRNIVEEISHDTASQGFFKAQDIDIYHITKPARIWISGAINTENKTPHEFFDFCEQMGYMNKVDALPDVISTGGAYLTMVYPDRGYDALSFGAEAEPDYDISGLKDFNVFHIPESKYVVFSAPKFTTESPVEHGSTIQSAWNAGHGYQYVDYGLEHNSDTAPVYECVDDMFGYSVWFPVRDIKI